MAKPKASPPRHRWLSLLGDWADIYRELEDGDDRAKAIVAAVYVENNLAMALLARLRFMSDSEQKFLFEQEHSALNSFSAKIDIGWAIALYGKTVRDDLHRMRQIRNKFAHELHVRSFDHTEVAGYCDKLVGIDLIDLPRGQTEPRDRRQRYIDLATHFGERFAMDSNKFQRPVDSLNKIRPDY